MTATLPGPLSGPPPFSELNKQSAKDGHGYVMYSVNPMGKLTLVAATANPSAGAVVTWLGHPTRVGELAFAVQYAASRAAGVPPTNRAPVEFSSAVRHGQLSSALTETKRECCSHDSVSTQPMKLTRGCRRVSFMGFAAPPTSIHPSRMFFSLRRIATSF